MCERVQTVALSFFAPVRVIRGYTFNHIYYGCHFFKKAGLNKFELTGTVCCPTTALFLEIVAGLLAGSPFCVLFRTLLSKQRQWAAYSYTAYPDASVA